MSLAGDGGLAVWELETGRVRVLPLGVGWIGRMDWSPDGRRLAVSASPGNRYAVLLVDAETGRVLGRTMEMESPPLRVVFSPDGTLLLTAGGSTTEAASSGGEARVWRADNGEPVTDWHPQSYTDAAFASDGLWVAVACDDGTASVWPARGPDGRPEAAVDTAFLAEGVVHVGHPLRALAFSPRGRRLLTLSGDRGVRLWDLSRRDLGPPRALDESALYDALAEATAPPAAFDTVAVPDAADTLVLHGDSGTVARRIPHPGDLRSVALAPGRRRVATAGSDDSVRVWDARTGAPVGTPLAHWGMGSESFTRMRFSPDGRSLATAAPDLSVRVWDVERGRPLTPLLWPAPGVVDAMELRGVAFALGGSVVVAGTVRDGGRMWDARTGELVSRMEPGWSVYLLPDSGALARREGPRRSPGASIRIPARWTKRPRPRSCWRTRGWTTLAGWCRSPAPSSAPAGAPARNPHPDRDSARLSPG